LAGEFIRTVLKWSCRWNHARLTLTKDGARNSWPLVAECPAIPKVPRILYVKLREGLERADDSLMPNELFLEVQSHRVVGVWHEVVFVVEELGVHSRNAWLLFKMLGADLLHDHQV